MISVTEAINLIKTNLSSLPPVSMALADAIELTLADDVHAKASVPPFHQSAMDGYAFCYEDFRQTKTLFINGEVAAGNTADQNYQPQTAIRIFTGAPLPSWADTVVMQEKTETAAGKLIINDEQLLQGSNVRTAGFEINKGELALPKGTVLTPAAIGFLTGVGITTVSVFPKPSVQIIVTGNELQKPGTALQPGQIYESNSVMLKAALAQLRITNVTTQQVTDDAGALQEAIRTALQNADLLLLTGGVSVGDYDFVVPAVEACDVQRLFHKVAQRPGKPLYAGIKDGKIVFGLPGNPASVLTCFYVYVTAALETLSMRKEFFQKKRLLLSSPIDKKIKLTQFLKAVHDGEEVRPLTAQESFRLSSFSLANCLLVLPEEKMDFAKGEKVETILLPYL